MRMSRLAIIVSLVVLAGCTSFGNIKPIYPEVGNPNFPKETQSLQPTFRWEAVKSTGATYDLIVYQGIKTESFWEGVKRSIGEEIYYREGLTQTEHKLEEPLQPGKEYYWTVRVRHGDQTSEWAKYDYTLFLGTAYMKAGNQPFIFKTPEP